MFCVLDQLLHAEKPSKIYLSSLHAHLEEHLTHLEKRNGYLERTESAMKRAMCGARLADRKNTDDMMDTLSLN